MGEIARAIECGAEIVKIFPGFVGGPGFIKAVRGPLPWVRLMPTGGVKLSEESIRSWIIAGASCLGMGSDLISHDLVEAGDFQAIGERVGSALQIIRSVRVDG